MKKRWLSVLLTVMMLCSMMSNLVLADEVTVIQTAEELAALGGQTLTGNYRLGADIDMTNQEMQPVQSFREGTFDGGGFTISGLSLTTASGNTGLFAELGRNAELTGILLKDCTVIATGGSYSGVAVLAGKISSSGVQIGSCGIIGGSVSATGSSAVYTGSLVGQVDEAANIENCFSTAAVSGGKNSSGRTGGLIGSVYYAKTNVQNCYSRGTVQADGGYIGGFVGYAYGGYSSPVQISNCYTAAIVSGSSYNVYSFAYVYGSYTNFDNCYFDSTVSAATANTQSGIAGKDTEELKNLAETLGSGYENDLGQPINEGYPILKWQNPDALYAVKLTVSPIDAKVIWDDAEQAAAEDGIYTFSGLTSGSEHTYTVQQADGAETDLAAQTGSITIGKADVQRSITLEANRYNLSFELSPADAVLVVMDAAGQTVTLDENKACSVVNGVYTYGAASFGYKTVTDSVTIDKADVHREIALEAQPIHTVTFEYGELIRDEAIQSGSLVVKTGDTVMEPRSENSLIYDLPVGYDYSYQFKSANYQKQTGTIVLADTTAAGNETITIPLAEKTAWGGSDDVLEPQQDSSGVYQIGSGAELAWLAQEVNKSYSGTYNAALTKDIDLGGEDWTPIGKSSSYAFKGIFDGQNHVISGLKVETNSTDQGLFGYINGGTVKNLTVDGAVKGGNQTGGIAGSFAGSGLIENCVNKAAVTGGNDVGGIVGKIFTSDNKTIQNCVNLGAVSGNNDVGGLIGYMYYKITLQNSYNRGAVTAAVGKAGGIVGWMNDSGAKAENCYTTGVVTCSSNGNPAVGQKSTGSVNQLYYLDSLGTDSNGISKTAEELKALAETLGDSFITAPASVNDGYPILSFQIARYDMTFTVHARDAEVTLKDASGSSISGTKVSGTDTTIWTFGVPDGEYRYTAAAFGKAEESGSITVNGAADSRDISLTELASKTVTVSVGYADGNPNSAAASVTVKWNDTVVAPEGGSYTLPYGDYTYEVKAKGYAKAAGQFSVSESSAETLQVTLQPSAAWDGEEREQPTGSGTETAPYQIESGAQLAWLADKVNGESGTYHAVLTDDINLGGASWTPMGKPYGGEFQGSFDGQNHTISGLKVENTSYAGLFGVVKNVKIQNLVVQGSVNGTEEAAGIAARMTGETQIINCGNEAAVNGKVAAGILANNQIYDTECTVTGCYNAGSITATERAAGIVGKNNGDTTVTDVYNTGNITSEDYAGGILGYSSTSASVVSNVYNSGTVRGSALTNTGAVAAGKSGTFTNCSYLAGSAGGSDSGDATALASRALQNLEINNAFTHVAGRNHDYPVLVWQNVQPLSGEVQLAENAAFAVEEVDIPSEEEGETQFYLLPTPQLSWEAVRGADNYVITLWQRVMHLVPGDVNDTGRFYSWNEEEAGQYLTAEQLAEFLSLKEIVLSGGKVARPRAEYLQSIFKANPNLTLPADTVYETQKVTAIYDVSGTSYDCTAVFADLPEGVYYATVSPMAEGGYVVPAADDVEEHVMAEQNPYNRMKTVEGLTWDGTKACWQGKENFAGFYTVNIYTVETSETGDVYQLYTSRDIDGRYHAVDLGNVFAVGNRYAFSVKASSSADYMIQTGLTDSPESVKSTVYSVSETELPGDDTDRTDWIAISSAKEWVDLANIEDVPVDSTDAQSPSIQAVEWSKKYYLTADLDFTALSAADQVKTKSIGNVTNRFMGIMDGNGHKITGLTLSNNDSGLFWYIGSTGCVYDMAIENANVLFSDNAAVLVQNNFGLVQGCAVENCNITADVGAVLGGMASRNYGIIRDSYVQGGSLLSNSQTATGHAGFVGANEEHALIERCWTSMNVNTSSDYSGGFVGLGYGGTIRDCFALGNVSSRGYSGGFAGRAVYDGNVFENCYAAGVVTATDSHSHGFIGESKPDSAFQPDPSEGTRNCYYNAASPADEKGAAARTLAEMKAESFLQSLNGMGSVWTQEAGKNNGLPYLAAVKVPEIAATTEITVQLAIASYDKESYTFSQMGTTVPITLDSNGNTRLVDVMDAAVRQGKLTYSYETSPEFGRFIKEINGRAVEKPDGWMFTVNDKLSNVSTSLTTIRNNDKILWFEGTTENRFLPPTWETLANAQLTWTDITTAEELLALAKSDDDAALAVNYRLSADLDLQGTAFPGIGSAAHPFTGIFDGQKHTVSGVQISGGMGVGFFNVIRGATVKNLNLQNVTVRGEENVGGLVGLAQATLDTEDMTQNVANLIGNCTVSGTVSGTKQVGGLVGLNGGAYDKDTLFSIASAVDKCTADAVVSGDYKVGGLIGENGGAVTKSAALGEINAPSGKIVGGFAGDSTGDIYESHAAGKVTGSGTVGGFVGYSSGTVKQCYSLGGVYGTDYIGGFAGSISKADTVISTGSVTVVGTASQGYAGGFAGNLGGTIAGLSHQVTVKNAYGNCAQAEGTSISAAGNSSSFTGDGAKEALTQMTLDTTAKAGAKLYELFGVNLPTMEGEASKFADGIRIDSGAEPGTKIDLLKETETVTAGVSVTYEVAENEYLTGGETLTLQKQNATFATQCIPVQIKITDDKGNAYQKEATVILPVAAQQQETIMDSVAQTFTESSDGWTVMDMLVYQTLEGKTAQITEAARQNALNLLIAEAAQDKLSVSDCARLEIVLRSMGVDTTKLYSVNSNKALNNAARLQSMDLTSGGHYAAPWILLAEMQGNVKLTENQRTALIGMLKENVGNGVFSYEYDGVTYTDPDTAGIALAALARFYDSSSDAKFVVDKILSGLRTAMDNKGSLGNANSDAMVVLGLLAVGENPYAYTAASGASVVDGMLNYVNENGNGFQYPNWSTGAMEDNLLATEQALRALVAMAKSNGSDAYNIYDFSRNTVQPGRATGAGVIKPPTGEPSGGNDINVTLTIKADKGTWLSKTNLKMKEGSTVYHAFVKALQSTKDMSAKGLESGYVKSITKGNTTLAEFDKGPNSGWLYNVNDDTPNVPLTSYVLKDGDDIVWFYSMDYQQDSNISSGGGGGGAVKETAATVVKRIQEIGTVTLDSGDKIAAARKAYDALTEAQKKQVTNYEDLVNAEKAYQELKNNNNNGNTTSLPFEDIAEHWAEDMISYAYEKGLMSGVSDTAFDPDGILSRGMLVTVLYRAAGAPEPEAENVFVDVAADMWYTKAVAWASENGIVGGYGDGTFGPNDAITREQLAAIFYRYAGEPEVSGTELNAFADADGISEYAQNALLWAVQNGLVNGKEDGVIDPAGNATRAETATIFQRYLEKTAA